MRPWQVAVGLISGQVKKSSQRRKLVRVTQVMRLGTSAAHEASDWVSQDDSIPLVLNG